MGECIGVDPEREPPQSKRNMVDHRDHPRPSGFRIADINQIPLNVDRPEAG